MSRRGVKCTDAELIGLMRLVEQHEGNQSAAAVAAGINRNTLVSRLRDAHGRGLSPHTKVKDPTERLKAENAALKDQVKKLQQEDETAATIRQEIWKLAQYDPTPPTWLSKTGSGKRGMPICLASDWHYGEVVRPEEVGGVNKFNAEIAAKRIERFASTVVDLCFNHMGRAKAEYPGIVLALGGDMISGDLHEELMATNDRTPIQCVNELTDLIGGVIELFATKFGHVYVPCVTGNHGRNTRKPRFKGRVFTSYEWNIYCNLEREFKRNKQIKFDIPEETDVRFNVYGHRYLLTHGDNLGVKGGDGIIGALGPIRRGEIKIRNAESQIDRDFDTIIMGHWHQYITLPGLVVNNSLKGFDEFARLALRAPYSRPSQALWFTHPEHGVTAHWQVYLEGIKRAAQPKAMEWFK